ncbi:MULTISPECIES: alpha/beta fold hydrolase [unclassified Lentimonas]|uniref:alpha/beta fold hydrolase n=1 Tax=unclassified Lentimonas TaxID=2630993 RepID=UPI00132B8668|nr:MULTISPECIES: alpha/beta fold hydrolase [unclassified Lentimonas]CAA6678500.1 Unannotated [Lentimonas sp. CC4]CAA6687495.1 Unannotated [Lentimonas sp. CC6]CAA7077654.1 Unannotated [Lentimonas sp. CC4]CAA7171212.1 Unannotated [Lentimonas sp. CC21]CAA7182659.1 Unannotated [Lentimonas sp. CC8]
MKLPRIFKFFTLSAVCSTILLALAPQAIAAKGLASEDELYTGRRAAFANPKHDDPDKPNVLLIGDSISIGYTPYVRRMLKDSIDVYRIPTNARNSAYGLENLDKWLAMKPANWDVIHFNWGLWDVCYRNPKSKTQGHRDKVNGTLTETPEQYRANLEQIVARLKATGATLIWCNTTPVPKGEAGRKLGDALKYNQIAAEIMQANGVLINDLYAHAQLELPQIMKAKGDVHYTEAGYQHLAKKVAGELTAALEVSGDARVMPYEEIYAKRQLKRMDRSKDGIISEQEAGGNWRRLKGLDLDTSGGVDMTELAGLERPVLPTQGEAQLNVLYKNLPEESLYLDLYYPPNTEKGDLPVVVFTHGGGWGAGSKEGAAQGSHRDLFLKVLDEGFCVAAVNYRLARMYGDNYVPECVADCKDAVRFLAKHADAYGISADKFYSIGNSAGGHLSMMLLLSPPDQQLGAPELADADYTMVAGVSWYGWANQEHEELFIKPNKPQKEPLRVNHSLIARPGLTPEAHTAIIHEMSPSTWLTPESPPLFMLHGTEDQTIIVQHAYWMKELADKRGADVEILIVEGAGHGWSNKGIQPTQEEVIQATVDFFVKHKK